MTLFSKNNDTDFFSSISLYNMLFHNMKLLKIYCLYFAI